MATEASIERHSRDIARAGGHVLLKLHHTVSGFPDRLLILRGGGTVFIEFKAPRGRLSPVQEYWAATLVLMGQRFELVRSVAEFREVLTSATLAGTIASQSIQQETPDVLDPA